MYIYVCVYIYMCVYVYIYIYIIFHFCAFCFSGLLKIALINTKQEFISTVHKLAYQFQQSSLCGNEVKLKRKIRPALVILFLPSSTFSFYFLSSLTPFPAANPKLQEFQTSSREWYLSRGCLLQLNRTAASHPFQVHGNPRKDPAPVAVVLVLSLCNVPSECSQGTHFSNVHAGELPRCQGPAFFMFLKNIFAVSSLKVPILFQMQYQYVFKWELCQFWVYFVNGSLPQ